MLEKTHKVQSGKKYGQFVISSATNSKFRLWKSLLESRGIKRSCMSLISGRKIVHEIVRLHPDRVRGWIFHSQVEIPVENVSPEIPVYLLSRPLYSELDVHGTGFPLLLTAIPEISDYETLNDEHEVILLIPFQDPANVGAVVRSAAAFGFHTVVLLSEAALPFLPRSIRAGGTAIFEVDYYKGPSIHELKNLQIPVVALSSSSDGIPLDEFVFPVKFALLPGLEGPGMPDDVSAEYTVSIPIKPNIESLNAAVASSIVLYEIKKRKANT